MSPIENKNVPKIKNVKKRVFYKNNKKLKKVFLHYVLYEGHVSLSKAQVYLSKAQVYLRSRSI